MWDFLDILYEQLSETFRWFMLGYFCSLALLLILYRYNLLYNPKVIGFIKKVSYFIFFPLYIGIVSWFLSATIYLEKDVIQLTEYSIDATEKGLVNNFLVEIVTNSSDWISTEVQTQEQIIENYLTQKGIEKESYTSKVLRWTLESGLDYIVEEAKERGTIQVGQEAINFPEIIEAYLANSQQTVSTSFDQLKGIAIGTIKSNIRIVYWVLAVLFLLALLILIIDLWAGHRFKKHPELSVFRKHRMLPNTQKKLEE